MTMLRRAMAICALALIASNGASASATESEKRLGAAMEKAFRACAVQVSRGGYFTAANTTELASVGVTIGDTPPGEYLGMFADATYGSPTFAKMASQDATIWLAGFEGKPLCKVVVGDTDSVLGARLDVDGRFRATTSWTVDTPTGQAGLFTQSFTLNANRPGAHLTLLITGPNTARNAGRGPQALMTIAVTNTGTN